MQPQAEALPALAREQALSVVQQVQPLDAALKNVQPVEY